MTGALRRDGLGDGIGCLPGIARERVRRVRSRVGRGFGWLMLAAVAVCGLGVIVPAVASAAGSPCGTGGVFSSSGSTASCAYTVAGTYTFTVPAGVGPLVVTAVGAAGGSSAASSGPGASVEDTAVPVSANQALSVVVGGVGADGTQFFGSGAGGSPGGGGAAGDYPNGGGAHDVGGGGGGSSGLLDSSNNPLVIAAGGGGGGGGGSSSGGAGDTGAGGGGGINHFCAEGGAAPGGGASGNTGGTGGVGGNGAGDGSNGSSLAGGQGGVSNGTGSDRLVNSSGGGGGGGYAGGGGGGGGLCAGGGGGGSSFGISGLTNETTASAPASVTISYAAPQQSTATSLTASPIRALETQQVALTAMVSPAPDGGTVAFEVGATPITGCGSQPISNGTATCQTSSLPVGTNQLTAVYSGDQSYQGSRSPALSEAVVSDTPQNLVKLTLQYVQGSAKFMALPAVSQKVIIALAHLATADLGKITPHLTAAQLSKLIVAYQRGVAALKNQGYLTAAQASTLDTLAGHVHP